MYVTDFLPALAGAAPLYVNGRFRVHAATGLQRYAEELLSRVDRAGITVRVLEPGQKLKGVRGHAWEQCVLPAHARHGFLWNPCNTGPVGFRNQVVTIHDMFPLDHPEWFAPVFVGCYRAIVPRVIRNARHVIAVSEYTRDRIDAAVPGARQKTTVIYSGVGPQFSPQATNAAAKTRHELGLPPGKYLLSVSSVEPRKNLKRVLHAWKKTLPELPPDVWLVLAGKKGSAAVFNREEFGTLPDRVLFTGYVPDHCLPGLYAGALAFVFPSLAEGFGFPPLEAMACGTPALTSNTSALPEVCGRAACFVHPWNIEEIAQGIHLLATDPNFRERLRARGLTQVRQFRWDVTAQKTWALLEQEMCAAKEVLPS